MCKIIVIDDEKTALVDIAEYFTGYTLTTFSDSRPALEELQQNYYDIVVSDYKMPGLSGFELLCEAKKANNYRYGILLTAYADKEILEKTLNRNLVNKLVEKPLKLRELKKAIDEGVAVCRREWKNHRKMQHYEQLSREKESRAGEIIGLEKGLKEIYHQLQAVARHDVPILITGKTGTGKEVIAGLIHRLSGRREENFITVNCTAIPEGLLESELFGHVKGAFTGAARDKPGKIELAHRGTLFLDEIGDMKPELQVKLLRVIQEKKIGRVGSVKDAPVDFRLIAATNNDLEKAIHEKRFREDLYYRINTFPIHLPPLKERREDTGDLSCYFLDRYARDMKIPVPEISEDALHFLEAYSWPGNVRELSNCIQRALITAEGKPVLTRENFSFLQPGRYSEGAGFDNAVATIRDTVISGKTDIKNIEKIILQAILAYYDNNITTAVKCTGIKKDRFYRRREE